jgi:hypothetical protein
METFEVLNDSVQRAAINGLDVLEKVDTFYNNAWDKLVLFGSILFAVVGVFLPIMIQWYQRRAIRLSEVQLRDRIKTDLRTELLTSIAEKFEINDKQIQSLISSANSKILFAQAKFSLEKNAYGGALAEFVASGYSSMEGNDYRTLQEILDYILKNCLQNLSIEEINDLRTAGICDFTKFVDDLAKKDDRAMFQSKIGDIKVKLSKLPKTVSEKPDQKPKEV